MPQHVYFSAADRQLESFLDDQAFERSLILNILFQRTILVPDVFFFISEGIERHLLGDGSTRLSLFEAALERGIVIPAMRAGAESFQGVLDILEGKVAGTPTIQGLRPRAKATANRLQAAADVNRDFLPVRGRDKVGDGFDARVEHYLVQPSLPDLTGYDALETEEVLSLWKIMQPWRHDCIHEARKNTRQLAGSGLLRGEVMNAVGRRLGLPVSRQIHDIRALFTVAKSSEEARALRLFFRWVCECYQLNHADMFDAFPNIPSYDRLDNLIATSSLLDEPAEPDNSQMIRATISIPPFDVLAGMPARDLIAVRQDLGIGYFAALRAWQAEPSERGGEAVREALDQYSAELRAFAERHQRDFSSAVLEAILISRSGPTRLLLWSGIVSTTAVVGVTYPWVPVLLSLTELGHAFYRWRARPTTSADLELLAHRPLPPARPDVTLPGSHNRGFGSVTSE